MASAASKLGGGHRLLKRFLIVLLPVFLLASSLGLQALRSLTFGDERNQIATRIGNLSARTASAISRFPVNTPKPQIEGVLSLLLADPAVDCAVVFDSSRLEHAKAPSRIGCKGHDTQTNLEIPLSGAFGGTLSVKYSLKELEARSNLFKSFTLFALLGSLLFASAASWLAFRLIVGKPVAALLRAIDISHHSGKPQRVDLTSQDELGTVISAFNAMQDKLESESARIASTLRRLDQVYNDTPTMMFSLDRDGNMQTVSGHWLEASGWDLSDVTSTPFEKFLCCPQGNDIVSIKLNILSAKQPLRDMPLQLHCKDGSKMDVLLSSVPDVEGGDMACLCVLSDISGLKAAQNEMQKQAVTDHLTGLPNRQGLFEHLASLKQQPLRQRQTAALLFIDLDNFKAVNDTLGHEAGDELLRAAAGRMQNCISRRDVFARLGGDEFAVVLEGLSDPADAQTIAERIIASLTKPFRLGDAQAQVGASVGIARFADSDNADDILRFADMAMYQSKQSGKNRTSNYSFDLSAKIVAREAMVQKIRDALAHDHFRLYLQPIIDISTMKVAGCEALLRMECPDGRLISPGDIIPVAEEAGLMEQITAWAVSEAIGLISENPQQFGNGHYISVNLSPRLVTRAFMVELTACLAAIPAMASSLVFEITETALFKNDEKIGELLAELRRTGARVALDDFGTGYSSIGHLHRFPVDVIKLDRSLVHSNGMSGAEDMRRRALIKATAALSTELGLPIVAEGIEDEATLLMLQDCKIRYGQGYKFSPPLPPKACLQWMAAFATRSVVALRKAS